MLLWREKIQNVPIMSLQTGGQLGAATEPIIDPHMLKVVAFYCEGRLIEEHPSVLYVDDIREFGQLGFIINDSDDIMPLHDLVRLQQILNLHFELLGKKVIDNTKHKLGKVNNFIIDSDSFNIMKLSVQQPIFKAINNTELIISRSQIIEINDEAIVVEAPTVKEATAKQPLQAVEFQNPFRNTPQTPQPEHADRR
ncbi:MAG TPA: PRC-barrel domain-containing protein [Candidatus Saccharimonadales bacterium]